MTASADVVAAAIEQVEQGFAAFALRANAKVPITEHGFKNATTNPDWVATQLKAPPAGNYGIVWPTEASEPVVVFDLDDGGGADTPWQDRLRDLIAVHGPLPPTKTTTTPSGGRHVFYRWPATVPIPPGDELFGFTVRWPGRGYLVGPGSSIDGRQYVAGAERQIAELPATWVYAAIAEHPPAGSGSRNGSTAGVITITGGFQLPERIPSGRRYATVRDYVASRYNAGLSEPELWELVRTQVAPRFSEPKTEDELLGDFRRVMAKIQERLGPPRSAGAVQRPEDAVAAVSPIVVTNLAEIPVEAVVWLWHRYLPVGSVTLFDGNPGEGKSTVVADLVARLTTGGEWPDGTPIDAAGSVLYITKEDDPRTQIRPRIEAAGGDPRQVDVVIADLLFPRDLGRFRELLEARRPRLVLLDPLMSYLEGKVKVISDNEVRSALMTPLAELARDAGCAILVIRHFNKGSGQGALLRGAGSLGGLAGAARMVLALATDTDSDDEKARVFGVVKSNYEARPPSLKAIIESAPVAGFQMTVSRATWHGPSETSIGDLMERTREEHQMVREAEELLARLLVKPTPSSEVWAAAKAAGHSRTAVLNAKNALGVRIDRSGFPGRTTWYLGPPIVTESSQSDAEPTGLTGLTGSQSEPYETPLTGLTGLTGETPLSPSQSSQSSGAGAPRAGARAREAEAPKLTVVPVESDSIVCYFYRDHQTEHRLAAGRWVCPICAPEPVS